MWFCWNVCSTENKKFSLCDRWKMEFTQWQLLKSLVHSLCSTRAVTSSLYHPLHKHVQKRRREIKSYSIKDSLLVSAWHALWKKQNSCEKAYWKPNWHWRCRFESIWSGPVLFSVICHESPFNIGPHIYTQSTKMQSTTPSDSVASRVRVSYLGFLLRI